MPTPYCYKYPRPAVTVDLVAFSVDEGGLRVLLIERKAPPFAGRLALPGGFLDIDEPIEDGARRELREETGLDIPGPVAFFGVFGDPGRDPRGRTISLAHAAVVREPGPISGGDDAANASWLDPTGQLGLAFDHDAILGRALIWLRTGFAWLDLLPEGFSPGEFKAIIRAVAPTPLRAAKTSLARLLASGRIVRIAGESRRFRSAPAAT